MWQTQDFNSRAYTLYHCPLWPLQNSNPDVFLLPTRLCLIYLHLQLHILLFSLLPASATLAFLKCINVIPLSGSLPILFPLPKCPSLTTSRPLIKGSERPSLTSLPEWLTPELFPFHRSHFSLSESFSCVYLLIVSLYLNKCCFMGQRHHLSCALLYPHCLECGTCSVYIC